MKKILVFIIFLIPLTNFSQSSDHIGGFVGGLSYYGDVNTQQMFYNPSPSLGLIYRRNFNPRYSLRGMVAGGKLSGFDEDFASNKFQEYRGHKFNDNNILEFSGQMDFNFFPCTINPKMDNFSPYVGLGVALLFASESDPFVKVTLPVAVGLKWTVSKRIELSAEWSYRKTFTDDLDAMEQYYTETSFVERQRGDLGSKDWYSFYGVILMYNMNTEIFKCSAYNER